jgi:hypothetical protein
MVGLSMAIVTALVHGQQPTTPSNGNLSAAQPATKEINPPFSIKHAMPEYSDSFKATHISGRCIASVTVGVNGMPQNIKLIRCSDLDFATEFLDALAKYRYRPATTPEGKTVSAVIEESISINFNNSHISPPMPVRYGFNSPPDTASRKPGVDGVYPLTKVATPPALTKFSDKGYIDAAFPFVGNGACDIVLTIRAKGKPSDPKVTHCERPALEKPAVESLLHSKYKPGSMNGVEVPMRVSIHLELGGSPAEPSEIDLTKTSDLSSKAP